MTAPDKIWADVEDRTFIPADLPNEVFEEGEEVYHHQRTVDELVEALELALYCHGQMFMTQPPKDAWEVKGVDKTIRALIAKHRAP